jgi:MFS family permease
MSSSLADYKAALTTPGARGPVVASLLGRLPIAMIGLALLLYVQRRTGSYAPAGLVSAGALVGVAVGSVTQGRLMDRFGPTRPICAIVAVYAAFVTAICVAIEAGGPVPLLVVLAVGVGMTEPQIGSASRAMWTRVVPPGPTRQAALAYEAISLEAFFILGPGIAGLLVAAPWPGTGLVVGAALMVTGSLAFGLHATNRTHRPVRLVRGPAAGGGVDTDRAGADPTGALGGRGAVGGSAGSVDPLVACGAVLAGLPGAGRRLGGRAARALLGPLATPGLRTVAVAAAGFGVAVGFVEVAVPAAATAAHHTSLGGLLLSVWSVSSVVFGVLYGVRPWPRPLPLRMPVLLAGFAVLIALLAAGGGSLWLLAVLLLVSGTLITPQSTATSAAIDEVAPPGTATEAFGWVITAVTLGLAAGQSIGGQLVTYVGPWAAFLASSAAGLLFAAAVFALRHTIHPYRATPAPLDTPAVPAGAPTAAR